MVKVKKVFGEVPAKVTVLSSLVEFNENGDAEVDEELAEILAQIPGYEVKNDEVEVKVEEPADEQEEPEAPKKLVPKPKAPKAPKAN